MPIKTILILLSLISYPSVSGAEQINWQKYSLLRGQYQITQNTEKLYPESTNYPSPTTQVIPIEHIGHPLLNPTSAFIYTLIPVLPFPFSPITITFGTIPAHIYVHDSALKIITLTVFKTIFITTASFGFIAGLGHGLGCAESNNTDCDTSNETAILVLGLSGWLGIYIYELIDIPIRAKEFNKENKLRQGFFVLPYAYKDQYRVNVGYRF